jgi:predicted DCC family thiol-disulfide oxidoreductase YuxK
MILALTGARAWMRMPAAQSRLNASKTLDANRKESPMPKPDNAIADPETPLRVLFDGGCPLCRREIAHYRQLTPRRPVHWIDISADAGACEAIGIARETAMARFHVLEGARIHTGAEAFVLLWSALPGWHRLASLVRALHLVPLMERGYVWFARRRWKRRCEDDRCARV